MLNFWLHPPLPALIVAKNPYTCHTEMGRIRESKGELAVIAFLASGTVSKDNKKSLVCITYFCSMRMDNDKKSV